MKAVLRPSHYTVCLSYSGSWHCILVNTGSACRNRGYFNLLSGSKYTAVTQWWPLCTDSIINIGNITHQHNCCFFLRSQNTKVAVERIREWQTGKLSPKDTWRFWISCYVTFSHQQDNSVWDTDKADNAGLLMPDLQIEPSEFSTIIVSVLCCHFKRKREQ